MRQVAGPHGRAPVADAEIDIEQVSFFLGEGFVITFQEREGDVFDPVRRRIRDSLGRIRSRGSDYLLYALVDAVVDNVFPIVEGISERLEDEEEIILREPDDKVSERLYEVRRKLIHLRRAVWPLRTASRTAAPFECSVGMCPLSRPPVGVPRCREAGTLRGSLAGGVYRRQVRWCRTFGGGVGRVVLGVSG